MITLYHGGNILISETLIDVLQTIDTRWVICLKKYCIIVLERIQFSSNSSFIRLENFEFEHILSSMKIDFLSLSLSLETSMPFCRSNVSRFSTFTKFE